MRLTVGWITRSDETSNVSRLGFSFHLIFRESSHTETSMYVQGIFSYYDSLACNSGVIQGIYFWVEGSIFN